MIVDGLLTQRVVYISLATPKPPIYVSLYLPKLTTSLEENKNTNFAEISLPNLYACFFKDSVPFKDSPLVKVGILDSH